MDKLKRKQVSVASTRRATDQLIAEHQALERAWYEGWRKEQKAISQQLAKTAAPRAKARGKKLG